MVYRVDEPNAVASLPAPPAAGTEGFYTPPDPAGGQAPVILRSWWLNMIQEEIRNVVVAAGITPLKTATNQLLAALRAMFRGQSLQVFTSSGTWTCPAGVTKVAAQCWGAGASGGAGTGGGCGAGGGGGGYGRGVFTVVPGTVYAITTGTGGASSSGAGIAGGSSSFASFMTASGGLPGTASSSPTVGGIGGAGGGVSGGTMLVQGYAGNNGVLLSPAGGLGTGGSSFGSTITAPPAGNAAVAGFFPGGGGSGGVTVNSGAGAPGLVILEY